MFLILLLSIISFVFFIISFYYVNFFNIGILLFLLSFIYFIYHLYKFFGLNSLIFIFYVLFFLYTFSVPLSIVFKLDIGWYRKLYFKDWDKIDYTLIHYLLTSNIFYISSLIPFIYYKKKFNSILKNNIIYILPKSFMYLSYISAFIASLFEFINFYRVGGFKTLLLGKLIYQSYVADIPLTLPSEQFFYFSVIFFFLSLNSFINRKLYLLFYFIIIFFYLFINIIIAERGILVISIFLFFISFYYKQKINKIKIKYLFKIFTIFFIFVVITIYRNIYDKPEYNNFSISNIRNYIYENKNRLYFYLNPANIEFGAPILVYRIFLKNNIKYEKPFFGLTYLYFIPNFLPTYIFPYRVNLLEKELMNKYFVERNKKSLSGMGYSFILESYINFWYFGPFIIGFLLTYIILFLEMFKYINKTKYFSIFYSFLVPVVFLIFRSSSAYIFSLILISIFILFFLLFIYLFLLKFSKK